MRSFLPVVLCAICVSASSARGQNTEIQPVHVSAGTVVTFYSQTRLNPNSENVLDELPKGTALKVRVLDAIDSSVDHDGLEFRGALLTPIISGNTTIVHADAEVSGLLVLLRSRSHPEGFRYELLITSISENGKSYELTASLNPSIFDAAKPHAPSPSAEPSGNDKVPAANLTKVPLNKN
jgi:hypothetical protein